MTPFVSFREFVTSDRFVGRAFADDSWKPPMTIAQIGGQFPSDARYAPAQAKVAGEGGLPHHLLR